MGNLRGCLKESSMQNVFQNCANVAVPKASALAMEYYHLDNLLWIFSLVLSFVIPFLFLTTKFSSILQKISQKIGIYWFFSIGIYLIVFIAINQLILLPFDFYASYTVDHHFGVSNQTIGKWFKDYGISTLLLLVGSISFIWIFYLLLEKSPKRWWFYSSIATICITFFLTFISPIWIDPLFNKIGPMKNKALEKELLALAEKAGVHNKTIYEIEKSEDTKKSNAYVTGLFGTERIVIWDTAISADNKKGLEFTMTHELGHYVLNHNWWFMLYFSLITFVVFYLTYLSSRFILKKFHFKLGFSYLYNIASFPLFLILINFFTLLATPIFNDISREMERDADRFGLNLTKDNQAAAELFANFATNDLTNPDPGPIYTFWRGTHPSLKERIEFCNTYCPWKK
ncbi:MAG: M48 family metallopeptidase [Chlamydiae bacterium]|nr:M48 family metallopeptidase [Chlamydiota bacterium]